MVRNSKAKCICLIPETINQGSVRCNLLYRLCYILNEQELVDCPYTPRVIYVIPEEKF